MSNLAQGLLFRMLRVSKKLTVLKSGTLYLEPQTALPTVAKVGEVCVFGGKLYVASAANTWTVAGTQT